MKEKLYAIPVNDAFNTPCECPVCAMYDKLETDAVDFTMDSSYMVDDVRMETDEKGFCSRHLKMVYEKENRLGMALVVNTHMNKINDEIKKMINKASAPQKSSLFSKNKGSDNEIVTYIEALQRKCFVCDRINNFFDRYIATIFYLYNTDPSFVEKYNTCRGFCIGHYKELIKRAPSVLRGDKLSACIEATNRLYIENMERVNDDVSWFIAKFDYRNENEPWKNAKDSLPRALIKLNR